MVWPEFRKLRRALTSNKNRGNQRKKSKEKAKGDSGLQQVHPGELVGGSGWLESNSVEETPHKLVCSDKGVKLLLKDGSWSSDDNTCDRTHDSTHPNKVDLEKQVAELRLQLAEERQNTNREQNHEARNGLRQELEKERSLRVQAEARLQEAVAESETCRDRLSSLRHDLDEMEEMVRSGMKLKCEMERLQEERCSLTEAYRTQLHKYQSCVASLQKENLFLLNQIKSLQSLQSQEGRDSWLSRMLLERVRLLEQENSSLVLENEQQRLQYEWCLDDVGRQVVRALVAQKGLQEECLELQRRVRELEGDNLALTTTLLTREQEYNSSSSIQDKMLLEACYPFDTLLRKSSPSLAGRSQDSGDSLASFSSDLSFLGSANDFPQPPGCAKMSSPLQWLRPESCRSSWASGLFPFFRLPSPLHEAADPKLWQRVLRPPSSSDNLDSLDTPSDDSLWWLSSSQTSSPVARPTTLDLAPRPDPARGPDFSALERRDGACSNIYEEVDLPRFPGDDSPTDAQCTNTVVRRSSVPARGTETPPLPPDRPRPAVTQRSNQEVAESPLSLGEGGGKDEGYSTMSSDVQCDAVQQPVACRLPSHPSVPFICEGVVSNATSSLQRCAIAVQNILDRESCALFESSVKDVAVVQDVAWDSRLDSGLGDSPLFHRLSSFSEPSCGSEGVQTSVPHRSSLDPSYEKIFKLLTPQGFTKTSTVQKVSGKFLPEKRSSSSSEVQKDSDTLVREVPLQTVVATEKFKSTTDTNHGVEKQHITNLESVSPKAAKTDYTFLFGLTTDCGKSFESPCRSLRRRRDCIGVSERLRKSFSDPYLDRTRGSAETCRSRWGSHGGWFPPLRLDLPASTEKCLSDTDLRLVVGFDLPNKHSQASGSSSVCSQSAGSVLVTKCPLLECGPTSDDDTENRSMVEQWLETRTDRPLQNVFAYDEEEVGNWSLDLSDLNQSQWEDQWEGKAWTAPLSKEGEEDVRPGKEETSEEKIASEQSEALQVEFNSDFYRLCSVGSVRSLSGDGRVPPREKVQGADRKAPENRVRPVRKERTRIPICKKSPSATKDRRLVTRQKTPAAVVRDRRSGKSEVAHRPAPVTVQEPNPKEMELDAGLTVADKIRRLTALLAGSPTEEESVGSPGLGRLAGQSRIPCSSPEKRIQQKRAQGVRRKKEGCGTSWVHFEADVDLSDPKARANLLDSMMASSSSSSEGEDGDQVVEHQHNQRLHALHRFRRHRKRATDPNDVISYLPPRLRASIVDRRDFFYRFGEKEREAVACFDFLDDLSTSPSDAEGNAAACGDRISLSDSCAESFSSSTQSLHRIA